MDYFKFITRRIFLGVCVAMFWLGVFHLASSYARVFTEPGSMRAGEYKYVENPDETWTEYYQDHEGYKAIRGDTYSYDEMLEGDRLYSEIAVDEGTTGQTGSIVIGHDGDNIYAAEHIVDEDLRTGLPYATEGEAEVGDDLIGEGIADDTLPSLADVVGAGAGSVLIGTGVAAVGIGVGIGIDELFGVPAISDIKGESNESLPEDFTIRNVKWRAHYTGEVQLGEVKSCTISEYLVTGHSKDLLPGEAECEFPGVEWHGRSTYEQETSPETWSEEETNCNSNGGENAAKHDGENVGNWWGYSPTGYCENSLDPAECPLGSSNWIECGFEKYEEREHSGMVAVQMWAGILNTFNYLAFPDEGLKTYENTITSPTKELFPKSPISPLTPKAPSEIPPPVRHKITEKARRKQTKKEEEEKVTPVPLIPPIEEGEPIPNPDYPEIPEIRPLEVYTEYAPEIELQGLTSSPHVEPEVNIDPHTGPEGVVSASPAPGSRVAPGTHVDVNVNPDDAPEPTGEVPGGIGPPSQPGFDFPNFGVLCKGFPFGVPCWLAETVEGWSSSAVAPELGIESFTVMGHTIPGAKFDVSKLEPIMVYVRPAMVIFITIGVVLLFFNFAKGGGAPSGGGIDDTRESFAENDAWHNTPEDEGGPQY